MKKNFIRYTGIIILLVIISIVIRMNTVQVYADTYSGTCGEDGNKDSVTWTFNSNTNILKISGTGAIRDFYYTEDVYESPALYDEWFAYKNQISFIIVDEGITSIGSHAFYGLKKLQYISLPDTLTDIRARAFKNSTKLNNITIPPNVTHIGERAFGDCNSIEEFILPEGLNTIDSCAFKDCRSLKSLKLPQSLTTISDHAFYGCQSLITVSIPNGVQKLSNHAFKNCTKLTYIYLAPTVQSIGKSCFEGCTCLRYINIPHGVKSITTTLFKSCKNLERISIPITVTSISDSAFDECSNINIYGSTAYPEEYAAAHNIKFVDNGIRYNNVIYSLNDGKAIVTGYFGKLTSADIPGYVSGYKVTEIWSKAFKDCYDLTQITLPSTIETIGKDAFKNCHDLVEVTNFSPLNIIASETDNGYVGYYAVNIRTSAGDPTIIRIDESGFITSYINNKNYIIGYTGNDTQITLPLNYRNIYWELVDNYYIYKYAFAGCSSLTICTISESVKSIGNYAFYKDTSLYSINIPESVTNIGTSTFESCTNIRYANIPHGIVSIKSNVFKNCENLRGVTIPITVTAISDSSFSECANVNIYGSTEYAESYANAHNISFIYNGIQYNNLKYSLNNGKAIVTGYYGKLISASIPEYINGCKVTEIWSKAFEDCYSLTQVTLPPSISNIGTDAFMNCYSLVEVTNLSTLNITAESAENGYVGYYAAHIRTSMNEPTIIHIDSSGFITSYINDTNYIIGYAGNDTQITLPLKYRNIYWELVDSYSIYDYAFAGNSEITGYTLNENINSIGSYAFYNNTSLNSITVPESVSSIGENAFDTGAQSFILNTYKDTYAQTYAKTNNIAHNVLKPLPKPLNLSMVSLEYTSTEWNGAKQNPAVTIKNNGTILNENVDYTIKYSNSRDAGTYTVTITGIGKYTGTVRPAYTIKFIRNHRYKAGDFELRVTSLNKDGKPGNATITKCINTTKQKISIPDTIFIGGTTFDITEIGKNSFSNNTKVKTLNIGKNVTTISQKAFYRCTGLKRINIYSKKITGVQYGSIKNINKKAVIYIPSSKKKTYKKLFTEYAGYIDTMKIIAF
ncbi:MAG: leucine-rich repeat protein [Lachnospiraceae bacterium]|nr:leucine-rich repeat protein [Lachnospiraceae bacterium]